MSSIVRTDQTPAWENKIDLIKQTVAKGTNKQELELFLYQARRTGLDPLSRQIHCVMRNSKNGRAMTIQTGIDGYRLIADRTGLYAGSDDYLFDEGLTEYQHIQTGRKNPTTATVTVYKLVQGQRVPFTASCRWEEYFPGEKQGFMWLKMPYLMLGKTAEALALRKAFPAELSGVYTDAEMAQAGESSTQEDDVIDVESTPVQSQRATKASTLLPWQRWKNPDDAILWADEWANPETGEKLFNAPKHAQNSYNKAKREYMNSLPRGDTGTARDFWKYWYTKIEARKKGEDYTLPAHGSQELFAPIHPDEATSFNDLN